MREIIRVLAKEVRRIRALVEFMELYGYSPYRTHCKRMEIKTLKRILGLMIKKTLDMPRIRH